MEWVWDQMPWENFRGGCFVGIFGLTADLAGTGLVFLDHCFYPWNGPLGAILTAERAKV